MTYCVIPGCISPQNPDSAKFCSSCGYKLRLKDRYRALYSIGRGGFGRTFLAVDEDIPSQPHCVIKQFYLESQPRGVSQKAIELFHQEAVRLDELGKHPQIPSLLAHFEQNQQLYLIQEWIAGQTLSKELQQKEIYNEKQIWALLQDILPVLQYIHQHQVIHRDIKPENIIRRDTCTKVNVAQSRGISYSSPTVPLSQNLIIQTQRNPRRLSSNKTQRLPLTESKELVLIDFGIAKFLTDTANRQTGTVIGTPEYMAPEQIRGKAFPASDLYSLGVTCLHLLTGVSPLDMHDSLNDCWVWRDFLPPGKSVSKDLGNILDKLVHNTVKKRYQSADQVLQALNSTSPAIQPVIHACASQRLISAVDLDYTPLQDLLARKKWLDADQETWDMLCHLVNRNPGYYLNKQDIANLPCDHLLKIDKLWVNYSGGRFGFSVQSRIYEVVEEDYYSFCDRIAWPVHNSHLRDQDFEFQLQAPVGHLPSRRWVGGFDWWRHAGAIAGKLAQCNIL